MYNHENQYRCDIVRSKSLRNMEDFLEKYAKIISDICPCTEEIFNDIFDKRMRGYLGSDKTVDNHRTENALQLLGMYYVAADGNVYASERTLKFLEDMDTPAFFKDVCYKMQFPNGSQTHDTFKERIENNISIRQFPFLLKVMLLAKSNNVILTKKEIGYYILNSLDVLQNKASPLEVYDAIIIDRKNGVKRDIKTRNPAWDWQHITGQIALLELANLVVVERKEIALQLSEITTIELFAQEYNQQPAFDVYSFGDLNDSEVYKKLRIAWNKYFSTLSDKVGLFNTTAEALGVTIEIAPDEEVGDDERPSTVEIGDEGERYVYEYEKRRVTAFNFRLAGKVIYFGKKRGLGYDIQSVIAEKGDNAEFVKYIEVKATTKRITAPDLTKDDWIDTLNITRNEWIAARQWGQSYSIYRVYFIRNSVVMFILTDIAKKCDDNIITAVPMTYRIDFSNNAVDFEIREVAGGVTDV